MMIHLSAEGLSFVLDVPEDRLPAVLHWGHAFPDDDLAALKVLGTSARAFGPPTRSAGGGGRLTADEDEFPYPGTPLLPTREHLWFGHQGLDGWRADGRWNQRFALADVQSDTEGERTTRAEIRYDGDGLELTVTARIVSGPLIELSSTVKNTGHQDYVLESLLLTVPLPRSAEELLDFSGRWTLERQPERTAFTTGTRLRESRRGRPGHDSAYVMVAGAKAFGWAAGEVHAVHVAWSGNSTYVAEHSPEGQKVFAAGELLLPGEGRLQADQSYHSPPVLLSYGLGLDDVSHRFHDHLRASTGHPSRLRPVSFNVWEAVGLQQEPAVIAELAELAAGVGAERFVLDDGWYHGRDDFGIHLGDWWVDANTWPDGLGPLIAHVTGLGMEFGLWFEPEMISDISDLANAHPEWIQSAHAEAPSHRIHDRALNLAIPECYDYVISHIRTLLQRYHISYVKWDHNRDLIDSSDFATGKAVAASHTRSFYAMVDALRGEFPAVEFESCAGGGGRVDLGLMSRMQRLWPSDNIDALDRVSINRWTSLLLPPEYLGTHVGASPDLTTSRSLPLHFRAAMAVMGHFGIEWDLRLATASELAELATWVEFYKAHRARICSGRMIRRQGKSLDLTGVVDDDGALYRLAVTESTSVTTLGALQLPGLDENSRYLVRPLFPGAVPAGVLAPAWFSHGERGAEVEASGTMLMHHGIELPQMRAATALFLEVEKLYPAAAVKDTCPTAG